MTDLRATISWLLLVMVGVVGGGAAVLGATQAPNNVVLAKAVPNTLAASNYSEVITETAPQGKETEYLVYQAPDKLGGYALISGKRTYIYIIGNVEYQSLPVAANSSPTHLVFYKQASRGAQLSDPAQVYLPFATRVPKAQITQTGSTYSFTVTQAGQTGKFSMQVNGHYVSEVDVTVATETAQLIISQVGTSPPVALPKGAKVIAVPSGLSPSGSG
jgi:hypothetical protein